MLPSVQQLIVLQERDQRIRGLQRDLKDIPNLKARAETRLADDEAGLAAAKARVLEVELAIKNLDLDAQTRRNTILRLKDQQFATRKNEEFRVMGLEIVRYEKDVHDLEDKEIELMEKLEAVKPDLAVAQAKLAATRKLADEEIAELTERAKHIEARLLELKAERVTMIEGIEPSPLGIYERLMKTKGDSAVVMLENGICGGCHVRVVSGTLNSLKLNEAITYCEQCGRVLFLEG
ncbi:C4-type zinc ribbon domain-containing protein [soil metagenome]